MAFGLKDESTKCSTPERMCMADNPKSYSNFNLFMHLQGCMGHVNALFSPKTDVIFTLLTCSSRIRTLPAMFCQSLISQWSAVKWPVPADIFCVLVRLMAF